MAELKIGGSDVKIMYGDREIGGAAKLEPGTILYISGQNIAEHNDGLGNPNSTVKITLPSVGKHWEGLKKIRIYMQYEGQIKDEQVFDVNLIDEQTQSNNGFLTIRRERSLTDEADKLIVTITNSYSDLVIIEVA